MRGVANKGALAREARFQAFEQPVEGAGQAGQVVAGVGPQPALGHALVQVVRRDAVDLVDEGRDGRQRAPRKQPPHPVEHGQRHPPQPGHDGGHVPQPLLAPVVHGRRHNDVVPLVVVVKKAHGLPLAQGKRHFFVGNDAGQHPAGQPHPLVFGHEAHPAGGVVHLQNLVVEGLQVLLLEGPEGDIAHLVFFQVDVGRYLGPLAQALLKLAPGVVHLQRQHHRQGQQQQHRHRGHEQQRNSVAKRHVGSG